MWVTKKLLRLRRLLLLATFPLPTTLAPSGLGMGSGSFKASELRLQKMQGLRFLTCDSCNRGSLSLTVTAGEVAEAQTPNLRRRPKLLQQLESNLWRLLLWLFPGNGGCQHRAWHAIKGMPCARSYTEQKAKPLEVLRFVCAVVSLMSVIGSDGRDKKCRLATKRFSTCASGTRKCPLWSKRPGAVPRHGGQDARARR